MSTVAIIPARGGSQGVPGKNLRPIGGVPLIGRAVRACRAARRIDDIYVTTDDPAIAEAARVEGARIIHRPAELAGHTATSESALLHALDEIADLGVDAQTMVFVQCTSPFIDPHDLDAGVALVADQGADSAFSGVETFEFLWRDADPAGAPGSGPVVGQNHDAAHRPRRQDRRPDFRETGAFYIMDVEGFRRAQHRFFGVTRVVPVSALASLEIDTAEELALADAFAGVLDRPSAKLPLDVDVVFSTFEGVFTDGNRLWHRDGSFSVQMRNTDLNAVAHLQRTGVPWVVVHPETRPAIPPSVHAELLTGVKVGTVRFWLREHDVDPARAAFVTSDPGAIDLMQFVGWPIATGDSPSAVQQAARFTVAHGGDGAVQDVVDRVLAGRRA